MTLSATWVFDSSGFPARWDCGDWPPWLGWMHIASDLLIWLAYLAISLVIVYFLRLRREVPFPVLFWLFGAFIVTCGATHLLDAVIFYSPVYRLSGVVKLATALASWATVIALVTALPKALAMRTQPEVESESTAQTAEPASSKAALRREVGGRERAEGMLRASETRFRDFVEQAGDGFFLHTPDGTIVDVNRRACESLGYSRGEMIGMGVTQIDPDVTPAKFQETAGLLASGRAVTLESRHRRKDGSAFPVEIRLSPFETEGRPLCLALVRDVTERKRADEALKFSETRYRRLFEAAQDGILIVDPTSRRVLDANPFMTRMFGYPHEELVGKEPWEIGLFRDIESNKAAFRALQEVGDVRYDNLPLRAKDGRRIEVEVVSNMYEDGAAAVIQCNIRDISRRKRAEVSLQESEERFRTLVEALPDAIFINSGERVVFCNPASLRLLGAETAAQILGKNPLELHPPQYHDSIRGRIAAMHASPAPVPGIEEEVLRLDGRPVPVLVTALAITDRGTHAILVVLRDLTEQRRAEMQMRHQEMLIRETAEIAHVGGWGFDPATGRGDWTPEAARILGVDSTEATVAEGLGFFEGENRVRIEAAVKAAIESGTPYDLELPITTAQGGKKWVRCIGRPIIEGGKVVRFRGSLQDITDRRRAEDTLRLRDRAIQAVAQGVIITDPAQSDNPIIFASTGFSHLTGYGAEEVLGRNCRFLQGKDTDPATVAQVRVAVEQGQNRTVEMLNYRKDGTPFWNALAISPVHDGEGRATHFVGVQADVTERRLLEDRLRQSQKMEVVGQLAGGVAHDFNNLLCVINGYGELLLTRLPQGDPAREMIQEMTKAGERAAGLTRQLLAFSRKTVLAPEILDLNAVVVDMEKMLRRTIGEDVDLVVSLQPGLGRVKADPGQVDQVLMNLCVNARDAMPKGGKMTIETRDIDLDEAYTRAHSEARPGRHVLLSISDTGHGMTEQVKSRIFEPFFTTKEKGRGTGLGLSTVFGIVQQSGGSVEVYSEPGLGTSFKVYLPRVEKVAALRKSSPGLSPVRRGAETVLVVEDEDAVRALTRIVLTNNGYTILEAGTGEEGLRVAEGQHGPIHLLISDVVMPELGGPEMAGRLVALRPEMKVLFLSGYTDDAIVRHGILQEKVNFLQKPFSTASLAQKVRDVLDG